MAQKQMIRYTKENGETVTEKYSASTVLTLKDLGIEWETFTVEVPDPVVMSDKFDRNLKVVIPQGPRYEELLSKGWYMLDISPDDLPYDAEAPEDF